MSSYHVFKNAPDRPVVGEETAGPGSARWWSSHHVGDELACTKPSNSLTMRPSSRGWPTAAFTSSRANASSVLRSWPEASWLPPAGRLMARTRRTAFDDGAHHARHLVGLCRPCSRISGRARNPARRRSRAVGWRRAMMEDSSESISDLHRADAGLHRATVSTAFQLNCDSDRPNANLGSTSRPFP